VSLSTLIEDRHEQQFGWLRVRRMTTVIAIFRESPELRVQSRAMRRRARELRRSGS
jgi:hypothetical protein